MLRTRILLIDDESTNLKILVNHFKDESYEFMYAPNGAEGYEITLLEKPDLVLIDWAMPIMNGLETILKIKAKPAIKDIPLIMATGVMTTSEDLKAALEAGAMDYVRKPYDKLELTSRIQAALRLSHSFQQIKEKNQEIQKLIDQKDRELAYMAITSHERDQFLKSLLEKIKELKKKPTDQEIGKLIKTIKRQVSVEESWSSFMHHFNNVHPDYFNILQNEGLTTNELKLAAYIKIGMSNKEIASMTGVGPGTVKSNLYRLKKKIGLFDEDLRIYLNKLKVS